MFILVPFMLSLLIKNGTCAQPQSYFIGATVTAGATCEETGPEPLANLVDIAGTGANFLTKASCTTFTATGVKPMI